MEQVLPFYPINATDVTSLLEGCVASESDLEQICSCCLDTIVEFERFVRIFLDHLRKLPDEEKENVVMLNPGKGLPMRFQDVTMAVSRMFRLNTIFDDMDVIISCHDLIMELHKNYILNNKKRVEASASFDNIQRLLSLSKRQSKFKRTCGHGPIINKNMY